MHHAPFSALFLTSLLLTLGPEVARADEPLRIPEGCGASLDGTFQLEGSPLVISLRDNGRSLVARRIDIPTSPSRLWLTRTGRGFSGSLTGELTNREGKPCSVSQAVSVIACDATGFVLRLPQSIALQDDCRALPSKTFATWHFLRQS